MIDAALACLDEETERSNATKLARRLTHSIKEQSSRMQRQTLVNKLVTKGYSFEIAKQVSESIELDEMMMRHYKEQLRKQSVYMQRLISQREIKKFKHIVFVKGLIYRL